MLLLDTVRAADNHESSRTDDVAEVVVDVAVVGEVGNIRKTVSTSEQSRDWVDRVSPGMTNLEIVVRNNQIRLINFCFGMLRYS